LPGLGLKPDLLQGDADSPLPLARGYLEQSTIEVEQVPGAHRIVEVGLFGQVGELALHAVVSHRLAEERGIAGRWEEQPEQHLNGGGLARAVAAQEPEDLTLLHGQRKVLDRFDLLLAPDVYILFREALDFNRS